MKKIDTEQIPTNINPTKRPSKEGNSFLHSVMGCSFIALADRYGAEQYNKFESKKDALSFLQYGLDCGEHMDIAVIDCSTNKMVWYKDFLGKDECQDRVNEFIERHIP